MRFKDYPRVFVPGAPLEYRTFFFGRAQELQDLREALARPGQHPIVVGNRGVGKTSLVHQALRKRESLGQKPLYITCNSHMTFNGIALSVLEALGYDAHQSQSQTETQDKLGGKLGLPGLTISSDGQSKEVVRRDGPATWILEPWSLFRELRKHRRTVIVLDEYDAIQAGSQVHRHVAELVKTLADNSRDCSARVIIVGVAQAAQDLLGRHESIERSAREIYVRPLRRVDVIGFLTAAEQKLDFKFAPNVKKDIADNSLGYPYYVHLVGLKCIDTMLQRDRSTRLVTQDDYERAMNSVVQQAFRAVLRRYKSAVVGLSNDEIELIRTIVALPRDRMKRTELMRLVQNRKILEPAQCSDALLKLQQERRLLYVSRNTDEVRFVDPLMAPFLRSVVFRARGNPESVQEQLKRFQEEG